MLTLSFLYIIVNIFHNTSGHSVTQGRNNLQNDLVLGETRSHASKYTTFPTPPSHTPKTNILLSVTTNCKMAVTWNAYVQHHKDCQIIYSLFDAVILLFSDVEQSVGENEPIIVPLKRIKKKISTFPRCHRSHTTQYPGSWSLLGWGWQEPGHEIEKPHWWSLMYVITSPRMCLPRNYYMSKH